MAYVDPTAADLKARFPKFNAVDDAIANSAIAEGKRMVDQSWTEGDYTLAIELYACHIMTLDGLGVTAEAGGVNNGTGAYQSITSGRVTLTRFSAVGGGGSGSELDATSYGSRFLELLRRNKGGPSVAGASLAQGASPPVDPYPYSWPYLWP